MRTAIVDKSDNLFNNNLIRENYLWHPGVNKRKDNCG
jgi:hypothetical protein